MSFVAASLSMLPAAGLLLSCECGLKGAKAEPRHAKAVGRTLSNDRNLEAYQYWVVWGLQPISPTAALQIKAAGMLQPSGVALLS